jgi:chromosome segregation ATPase
MKCVITERDCDLWYKIGEFENIIRKLNAEINGLKFENEWLRKQNKNFLKITQEVQERNAQLCDKEPIELGNIKQRTCDIVCDIHDLENKLDRIKKASCDIHELLGGFNLRDLWDDIDGC